MVKRWVPNLPLAGIKCYDFMDEKGETKIVTAVIAPITIEMYEHEGECLIKVSYGCSRGGCCYQYSCRYSKAYREKLEK